MIKGSYDLVGGVPRWSHYLAKSCESGLKGHITLSVGAPCDMSPPCPS